MYALTEREFLTPKGNPVRMRYREDSSDFNTISSVMQPHDEYGLAALNLTGRAADVGAHVGSVSVALLVDNPDLLVTAVEPVPPNAELLRENLRLNGVLHRATIHMAAVGSGTSTTIRYGSTGMDGDTEAETENATHHAFIGNSALVYRKAPKRPHQSMKVPVLKLSEILPLDFIKIDCEGGEWGFLADPATAEVPLILGEVHPVLGHAPLHVAALLQDSHEVTFTGPPAGPCGFRAVRR